MATPDIGNLLKIVMQMQQAGLPSQDVAEAGANNAATDVQRQQEELEALTRPGDVEAEPLSKLQGVLQSIFSAGSVYAGGLNRNIQPQNFGQNILDQRQRLADTQTADADQSFEDERAKLLFGLQQAIRQEETDLAATTRTEDIDLMLDREKLEGTRLEEERDFRSTEAQKGRDATREQAQLDRDFRERLAGLNSNVGKRAAEESSRVAVNLAQDMLMGNPATGQKGLADQMREISDPDERQDIARRAIENIEILMLDEDLTPNSLKTLSAIRSRMVDIATSTPEALGVATEGGGSVPGLLGAAVKGSTGGNIFNFHPEQFLARHIFPRKERKK